MPKKIRIKDIAELAGVSTGSVDRILHNRGNVSEPARQAIENALKKLNYKPNIHISAISLKKKYNIVITIPQHKAGEYWAILKKGIQKAVDKYERLNIKIQYCFYNQFDLYSCKRAFEELLKLNADAVIIGPTFRDETIYLTSQLSDLNIPYVFVDSTIDSTSPLAFFIADPNMCGRLLCKLITSMNNIDSELALFQAMRVGDESANTTILRKAGFMDYYLEKGLSNKIHKIFYSAVDIEKNHELIGDFFKNNTSVKGIVVFNSRGNIIADYLKKKHVTGVKLVCVDMTKANIKALKEANIDFILGQRPEQQGFMAMETLLQYLIYGKKIKTENYIPIDIISKENVDLFVDFNDMIFS